MNKKLIVPHKAIQKHYIPTNITTDENVLYRPLAFERAY